ncbi:MAG: DegT/DnrJ/EryC1/StrS family aminotransferase [Candidatus Omnitrophica bacterium]|nr:DegT/DnrJ/EryC1/StrS family aminotransferase [Candidatus Omnitrophota bacterium]
MRKLPIISPCVTYRDILSALYRGRGIVAADVFAEDLSISMGSKHLFLTNSGIAAFYIVLKALKETSARREVILPAYTAGSLVVAVKKAGLKPVLCDITLEDFNLDEDLLSGIISSATLAVVGVHGFGINMKGIAGLRARMPNGVFLIEDCAQSMGSRTLEKASGAFGDVGFFSFNRGKNFPIYGGGCIVTDNDLLARDIRAITAGMSEESGFSGLFGFLRILAFSLIGNPFIYGPLFPLISLFKETSPAKDFTVKKIGGLQAELGSMLMAKRENLFSTRHKNGMALISGLKDIGSITPALPQIPEGSRYVFNRLPVVFRDINTRIKVEDGLRTNGIETSRMYLRPLHHIFEMGYAVSDFPKAVYLSERLLTLPTHPDVSGVEIGRMIDIIGRVSG